jgi:hypothetical protein
VGRAADADLALNLTTVNAPVRFAGDRITQAFRFWLEHPDQDYGYALHLAGGPARPFLDFRGGEVHAVCVQPLVVEQPVHARATGPRR